MSVLIFGGGGALGQAVVLGYKAAGWKTFSVDLRENPAADASIIIKGDGSQDDATKVVEKLKEHKAELDAVVSVAGGFVMESINDPIVFSHVEKMISFNVRSAIAASFIASHTLKQGGLLVLTGANSAYNNPTPAMIGYGISKAATHHLVSSLAQPGSGLPKDSSVVCLLPVMLDTPMNRQAMPDANYDDWTPLETVAQTFVEWSTGKNRPHNGAFVTMKTQNKKTEFIVQK